MKIAKRQQQGRCTQSICIMNSPLCSSHWSCLRVRLHGDPWSCLWLPPVRHPLRQETSRWRLPSRQQLASQPCQLCPQQHS